MIFYFSGTGNTKWAANTLCQYTGERIVCISDIINDDCTFSLSENERIGFCFPVHGWRPPKIVRDFIDRLTITNATGHYCYLVCTAGDNVGRTVDIFRHDLEPTGIILNSAFSLLMPESYVGLPFMDVDTKENEKVKIEKATKDLKGYAASIIAREEGIECLTIGRWPRINSNILGAYFVRHLVSDRPFHVKTDACVKCGICKDVCPMNDIEGGLGYAPVWKHNGSCLTCFACYHHCPHHAIEFGKRTKHKGQYFFGRSNH